MKRLIIALFLTFFFSTAFAQEARIDIEQIGFGATPREVYFSIHNVGSVPITDVTVYVDGNITQTIQGRASPGRGFEMILYLDPGEHLIEVKTPEGAYDSLKIGVSPIKEKPIRKLPEEKAVSFLEENKILIALALIIVIVVIIWLLIRKPKLE